MILNGEKRTRIGSSARTLWNIGIINSITGIGITLTLWNLIVYDIFSIALILGLITCHLALIIFFEDLIAVQAKIKKKY
jgi:hypothetical protein